MRKEVPPSATNVEEHIKANVKHMENNVNKITKWPQYSNQKQQHHSNPTINIHSNIPSNNTEIMAITTDQEVKTGITTDLKAKTPSITHHKTTRTSTEDTSDLDHITDIGIPTSSHDPFFKPNNNTITIDQWDNNNTTITLNTEIKINTGTCNETTKETTEEEANPVINKGHSLTTTKTIPIWKR